MAVFMINICKFNGCGITFPSLGDLIQHIEDTHIDYDPLVVEQKEASQPSCLPLSYVLRFFTEASRREFQSTPPAPEVRRRVLPPPKAPSIRSTTPTGSEFDDEDMMTQSEDSNDSWTTVEEYSSEFILRYGVKQNPSPMSAGGAVDKPFACPVPGCKKRYKNVNGIKYHSKNGHKKDGKIKKGYKCHCGKSYKTAQGLKTHSTQHSSQVEPGQTGQLGHVGQAGQLGQSGHVVQGGQAGQLGQSGHVVQGGQVSHVRPMLLEALDGHRLVRIYESLKARPDQSPDLSGARLARPDPSADSSAPRLARPRVDCLANVTVHARD